MRVARGFYNMIPATEARVQSENRKSEMQRKFEEDQLKFIENCIREAIDRGECEFDIPLSAATYRYMKIQKSSLAYKSLEENGYKIEMIYCDGDHVSTIINW